MFAVLGNEEVQFIKFSILTLEQLAGRETTIRWQHGINNRRESWVDYLGWFSASTSYRSYLPVATSWPKQDLEKQPKTRRSSSACTRFKPFQPAVLGESLWRITPNRTLSRIRPATTFVDWSICTFGLATPPAAYQLENCSDFLTTVLASIYR